MSNEIQSPTSAPSADLLSQFRLVTATPTLSSAPAAIATASLQSHAATTLPLSGQPVSDGSSSKNVAPQSNSNLDMPSAKNTNNNNKQRSPQASNTVHEMSELTMTHLPPSSIVNSRNMQKAYKAQVSRQRQSHRQASIMSSISSSTSSGSVHSQHFRHQQHPNTRSLTTETPLGSAATILPPLSDTNEYTDKAPPSYMISTARSSVGQNNAYSAYSDYSNSNQRFREPVPPSSISRHSTHSHRLKHTNKNINTDTRKAPAVSRNVPVAPNPNQIPPHGAPFAKGGHGRSNEKISAQTENKAPLPPAPHFVPPPTREQQMEIAKQQQRQQKPPIFKRWQFWAGMGLFAAVGVAIFFLLRKKGILGGGKGGNNAGDKKAGAVPPSSDTAPHLSASPAVIPPSATIAAVPTAAVNVQGPSKLKEKPSSGSPAAATAAPTTSVNAPSQTVRRAASSSPSSSLATAPAPAASITFSPPPKPQKSKTPPPSVRQPSPIKDVCLSASSASLDTTTPVDELKEEPHVDIKENVSFHRQHNSTNKRYPSSNSNANDINNRRREDPILPIVSQSSLPVSMGARRTQAMSQTWSSAASLAPETDTRNKGAANVNSLVLPKTLDKDVDPEQWHAPPAEAGQDELPEQKVASPLIQDDDEPISPTSHEAVDDDNIKNVAVELKEDRSQQYHDALSGEEDDQGEDDNDNDQGEDDYYDDDDDQLAQRFEEEELLALEASS